MRRRTAPAIVFLTGASGSGKTSIVRAIGARNHPTLTCLHFDSIGVPDRETMMRQFGSGERWQEETTRRWIATIVAEYAPERTVILEGQARPSFVEEAFAAFDVRRAVALVHCDDDEREARLIRDRRQPELATAEMRSWSAFLRREAVARELPVIDTTRMAVADAAMAVLRVVACVR